MTQALPTTMQAAVRTGTGGPEVLEIRDDPHNAERAHTQLASLPCSWSTAAHAAFLRKDHVGAIVITLNEARQQ